MQKLYTQEKYTYTLSQSSGRQGSGPELTGVSDLSSLALPDPNERLLLVWPLKIYICVIVKLSKYGGNFIKEHEK